MDYLLGLQPWDGECRIDASPGWLSTYLGVESSRYSVAVGRAWLVSAIARVMEPGCQADHMLVIEGEQGIGKTSALRILSSPWHAEITIDPSDKDSALLIHGLWIYEWGELAGMARREAEAIKGFLTRTHDRLRRPYGRVTDDIPRRGVGAATTNERTWLQDSTGGRRFWPVRAMKVDFDGIARDRDQLWAEALYLYRGGARWWLSREDEAAACVEQTERFEADPWETAIADYVDLPGVIARDRIETSDLLAATGVKVQDQTSSHARRITKIMQRMHWTPCQVPPLKRRGWKRPATRKDDVIP